MAEKEQSPHEFFYWEFHERGFQQAVRHQNFKAIRSAQDEPLALFDLTKDIRELNDVADENPEVVARIEAYLESARSESPYFPK